MTNPPANLVIQPAAPDDAPTLFELIKALAEYEKLSHEVVGNVADLQHHLFGPHPYAEAILAKVEERSVGFALFFHNYSTFLMRPGIYLEDVFVLPLYRRQGIGKALITYIGKVALERNCGRLEWNVLDWNQPAIAFYQGLGAEIKAEWRLCRVSGSALTAFERL